MCVNKARRSLNVNKLKIIYNIVPKSERGWGWGDSVCEREVLILYFR